MFLLPLTLLGCDAVQPELLDSELSNRDLQIEALTTRLDALEATVASQADTIAAQDAALAALGQSVADGDAALGARVDALESTDTTVLATLDLHAATLDAHASALDEDAARLDGLDGAVADLGARMDVLEDDYLSLSGLVASQGLGIVAAEARLGLIEGTLSGLDLAGVGARLDDIDGRVGLLEDQRDAAGETWDFVETVSRAGCTTGTPTYIPITSYTMTFAGVEHVAMSMVMNSQFLAQIRVRLTMPSGTLVDEWVAGTYPGGYRPYLSATNEHFWATEAGTYTLSVEAMNGCDPGGISSSSTAIYESSITIHVATY